jgi:hypothetical protein
MPITFLDIADDPTRLYRNAGWWALFTHQVRKNSCSRVMTFSINKNLGAFWQKFFSFVAVLVGLHLQLF